MMAFTTPVNVKQNADYTLKPSTLEDIDYALYNYLNDGLNIFTDTNSGFNKVPIIYAIPERARQIKNNPNLRQDGRTLVYPLISISRTAINQDPSKKGRYGVHIPPFFTSDAARIYNGGASIEIARTVNQSKTKNFANANAIKKSSTGEDPNMKTFPGKNSGIVYDSYGVSMPQFVDLTYNVLLVSEYQQQMNQMVSPFISNHSTPSVFDIFHEGNRYEAFISPDYSIADNKTGLETEERVFKTTLTINVLGYLIGGAENQETPNVVKNQSAARLTIQRERVILGDDPDFHFGNKSKYRP